MWFPNMSDTNRSVQSQKQARSLNIRIEEEEEVYYPCSENKGADQLRGYREADLRLCFRIYIQIFGFLIRRLKYCLGLIPNSNNWFNTCRCPSMKHCKVLLVNIPDFFFIIPVLLL